jgi:hypothetical protein
MMSSFNLILRPLYFAFLVLLPLALPAAVWRVDNTANRSADFTSLQAALTDAQVQDGDTLIISGRHGGDYALNKSLQLVGYGYYLESGNTDYSFDTTFAGIIAGTVFITSSVDAVPDGATITGLELGGVSFGDARNVTVRRCKTGPIGLASGTRGGAQGILILQNMIIGSPSVFYNNATITSRGSDNGDIYIIGNIVGGSDEGSISFSSSDTCTVAHNLFYVYLENSGVSVSHGEIYHNILIDGSVSAGYANFHDNLHIGAGAPFLEVDGNWNLSDDTGVFIGSGSEDGTWLLAPASPAAGAGMNGEDLGPFDGPFPYVLSGLPTLPVITELSLPAIVNEGDQATISITAEVKP